MYQLLLLMQDEANADKWQNEVDNHIHLTYRNAMTHRTGIKEAVESAGGAAQLAVKVGVTRQMVYYWLTKGYIPPKRIPKFSRITGISEERLLGDVLRSAQAEEPPPVAASPVSDGPSAPA